MESTNRTEADRFIRREVTADGSIIGFSTQARKAYFFRIRPKEPSGRLGARRGSGAIGA